MRLCALGHKGKINKESCLKSYLIAWSVSWRVCCFYKFAHRGEPAYGQRGHSDCR